MASRLLVLFFATTALMVFPVSARAQNVDSAAFMAGLLRNDGVLVPIAEFHRGRWRAPLADDDSSHAAITGDAWFTRNRHRADSNWYFWKGSQRRVLAGGETVQVENHCQMNWGVRTDYDSIVKLKSGDHHENLGVALDVDVAVRQPELVASPSREWSRLFDMVAPAFDRLEATSIARQRPEYVVGYPPEPGRKKVELSFSVHRIHAIGGRVLYEFSASKTYPDTRTERPCESTSRMDGWIERDRAGRQVFLEQELGVVLDDCDGKSSSAGHIMGVLNTHGRTFLFQYRHGYEDEGYAILELVGRRMKPLLYVSGGGC